MGAGAHHNMKACTIEPPMVRGQSATGAKAIIKPDAFAGWRPLL
jgi:hypothetical protein